MIERLMEEHSANRTMLIISHRISTLQHCDKVVVFDQGVLVERGTFEESKKDPTSGFGMIHALQ